MKTKTLVLAAVMFLGLGAAAFAQATGTFSVGSVPVVAVVNTGLTEASGAITFNLIAGPASVDGTFTINYGVPITVPLSSITVSSSGGATAAAVNTALSNNNSGVLVINVFTGNTSVTVSNVRVAVAGTTLTSLSASITATGNAITAGQTSVVVISSIAPGISSVSKTTAGTLNGVTGVIAAADQPSLVITEGFLNAWQPDSGTANFRGSGIRLTVNGLPPANVTVTFPLSATTDKGSVFNQVSCNDFTQAVSSAVTITSSSSTPTQVCYKEVSSGSNADTTQEKLTITAANFVTFTGGSSDLPLAGGTLTFTATMAPIGTAFGSDGKPIPVTTLPSGYIPRFVAAEVGPATLLNIVGNKTILLMPFAQVFGAAGYDTGIAIANTTTDPGKSVLGFGNNPTKQNGAITFFFFPTASGGTVPASFSYTTKAGSPGSGLDANGLVPSGSTYVVLASQLLSAAGKAGDFSGYIFAIPGFTNAHGLFVISNFTTFSQGALMPVIQAPRDSFVIPTSPIAEQVTF